MNSGVNTSRNSDMDRFDVKTKTYVPEISIKEKSIILPPVTAFEKGNEIVIFIAKDGSRIELEQGHDGFAVTGTGYGGSARTIFCPVVIECLKKRGAVIPQKIELQDMKDGRWGADLLKNSDVGGKGAEA